MVGSVHAGQPADSQVVLCGPRRGTGWTDRLVRELERAGWRCWVEHRDLRLWRIPDERREEERLRLLDRAVAAAHPLILLRVDERTPTTVEDEYLRLAQRHQRQILQVVVDGAPALALDDSVPGQVTLPVSLRQLTREVLRSVTGVDAVRPKGQSGPERATVLPEQPCGAFVLVGGLGAGADGRAGVLRDLASRCADAGIATARVGLPHAGTYVDWYSLPDLANAVEGAITELRDATGLAPGVLGVDVGGLVAARVAVEGRARALVLWDVDREVDRDLQFGYAGGRARMGWWGGDPIDGSPEFLTELRELAVGLDDRRLPVEVPLLSLSALAHPSVAETAATWIDARLGRAKVVEVSGPRDLVSPSAGWSRERSLDEVVQWLAALDPMPVTGASLGVAQIFAPHVPASADRGKVFISYRQSDGTPRADRLESVLNATGIRTFRDNTDLASGNVADQVKDALRRECAGAVLIVTPQIEDSRFIPEHELPGVLAHRPRHQFALTIDNAVKLTQGDDGVDPARNDRFDPLAPDRKLGTLPDDGSEGTLQKVIQFDLTDATSMDAFLRGHLDRRLAPLAGRTVYLDIRSYGLQKETFDPPRVTALREQGADLRIAVDDTQPRQLLSVAFPVLSKALHALAPERIVVSGGGRHPNLFALGGALVDTRIKCPVTIVDEHGEWGAEAPPDPHRHRVVAVENPLPTDHPHAPAIGVYLDLVKQPNTQAYDYVVATGVPLAGFVTLSIPREDRWLLPGEGTRIADEVIVKIRAFASARSVRVIHLFAATPFPLSVMIGRRFNVYEVVVYNHVGRDGTAKTAYAPALSLSMDDSHVRKDLPDGVA